MGYISESYVSWPHDHHNTDVNRKSVWIKNLCWHLDIYIYKSYRANRIAPSPLPRCMKHTPVAWLLELRFHFSRSFFLLRFFSRILCTGRVALKCFTASAGLADLRVRVSRVIITTVIYSIYLHVLRVVCVHAARTASASRGGVRMTSTRTRTRVRRRISTAE